MAGCVSVIQLGDGAQALDFAQFTQGLPPVFRKPCALLAALCGVSVLGVALLVTLVCICRELT